MRETLRDYVVTELAETAATGLPLNRPLFFDAPADAATWDVTDQFYFGRDYMVRLYPATSNASVHVGVSTSNASVHVGVYDCQWHAANTAQSPIIF